MSREIKADFEEFVTFIERYRLPVLGKENPLILILSEQHKKYFSYLTFIAELNAQTLSDKYSSISEKQMLYIQESCSDIGNSLFMMSHGAYKASRMMLRSSIETFIKGFNADDLPNIYTEKSVYQIFEDVGSLPFYSNGIPNTIFIELHRIYKELCKDTHTASTVNMAKLTALQYFPAFNIRSARAISQLFLIISSLSITLLALKYPSYLFNSNFKNKDIILNAIPKIYRRAVMRLND